MRLVKFILILSAIIFLGLVGGRYYFMNKIATDLNSKYANKKFAVRNIDKADYFITFKEIKPTGFQSKISWEINGWREESRTSFIDYKAPIEFGYDLLKQEMFISYNGDIVASYKPIERGFGSLLRIDNYKISVDLPFSRDLLEVLRGKADLIKIINHFNTIYASTKQVEIFDLSDKEKYYDKEFEQLKLTFSPRKIYENLDDFLNNIPNKYIVDYKVKTLPNSSRIRVLPASLFYGFLSVPAGVDLSIQSEINTVGEKFSDFMNNLEIKANINCDSDLIELSKFNLYYKSGNHKKSESYAVESVLKMKIKSGFFDKIFDNYNLLADKFFLTFFGKLLDGEIQYLIKNKEDFRFDELENAYYDLAVKMSSEHRGNKIYLNIEDLSVFSEKSGVKIKHNTEIGPSLKDRTFAGVLFINNYQSVADFTGGYIYRFGKFRALNDKARALYIDTNKAFMKSISDYPNSTSNDLSFEYKVESKNPENSMFGSAKIDHIPQLYKLMLYRQLFDKVGHGGNVLGRMQEILPEITGEEPILKKILPKISGGKVRESIKNKIDKIIPKTDRNNAENIIPNDKTDKKD